jgi:CHASE2 domain-containing sensor protein
MPLFSKAQPHVFISYRRDDSWQAAQLIREELEKWLSPESVFMDVRELEGGDPWREELDRRLDWADTVVVVIGKGWLASADARGRRLDRPDDWVRWEIAEALRRRRRVIPVLVDGAPVPAAADLPDPLKPLTDRQALPLSNLRFQKDIETLIEAIQRQGRVLDLLAQAQLTQRLLRVSPLLVLAVVLGSVSLAWVSLFDLLRLDSFVANVTMFLGDTVHPHRPSGRLVVVAKEPATQPAGDGAGRLEDAALIDALSQQGAERIVFDVFLRRNTASDATLLEAIRVARGRGSQVVFGFNDVRDGRPVAFAGLAEAASALGSVCIAKRLNLATLGFLVVKWRERLLPALPLVAAFGPVAIDRVRTDVPMVDLRDANGQPLSVPYSSLERVGEGRSTCPVLGEGGLGVGLLFPLSSRDRLRDPARQRSAAEVLARRDEAGRELAGKIVLVGVREPSDKVRTRLDGSGARFGYEFHADAVSALLEGRTVRVLGLWGQWVLMLLVAGLAVALRAWRPGPEDRLRPWMAGGVLLLYSAVAVAAYVAWMILLNIVYQIGAFLLAYWLYGVLERRWRHAQG